MRSHELRFVPYVIQIDDYLERYRPWLQAVVGCAVHDAVTLETDLPFGDVVIPDLLAGALLTGHEPDQDDEISFPPPMPFFGRPQFSGRPLQPRFSAPRSSAGVRALVSRWELPTGVSPKIGLEPSSSRRTPAWYARWKDTPVALWLQGCSHGVVALPVPVVYYRQGPTDGSRTCVLVNRRELAEVLARLREFFAWRPKRIHVIGAEDILLSEADYDWQQVVLAPELVRHVQEDFERFLSGEAWFRARRVPYRRRYLLHGPPGNGKTSVARVMASHPSVTAYGLNFSMPDLDDGTLADLFAEAGRTPPALVIVEDLDRLYGREGDARPEIMLEDNRTRITLPHLLNCLDGLYSVDGVIVVATANRPRDLDPALRRRFNMVAFSPPSADLRCEYFRRRTTLDDSIIALAARQSEGFSFAELAEAFTTAGLSAHGRGDEIGPDDLTEGLRKVRRAAQAQSRGPQLQVGFAASRIADE